MISTTFSPGDRITLRKSGEAAVVIRLVGADAAVIRFDADAAYNAKHALAPSNGDIEFPTSDFTLAIGGDL